MNSAEEELVKSLREANKAIVREARRTASPKEFKPNPANYIPYLKGQAHVGGEISIHSDYTIHTDDYGNKYYVMVNQPQSKKLTSNELEDKIEEFKKGDTNEP